MKINIKHIFILFTFSVFITGCSDYLDIVPDNIATIDDAFDDESSAESYLFTCYSHMPSLGDPRDNAGFHAGDEAFRVNAIIRGNEPAFLVNSELALGAQSVDNSYLDYWSGGRNGTNLHRGINDCNIFLENIEKLRYIDEDLRKRWIAEVKFLKAYYHFYLFRMYGPIIIYDTNLPIDVDIEEVHKFRNSVDECVTYIADLFLEASMDLPLLISDRQQELGRATKGAALALRAKVLATGASPLFNGNSEYANIIDSNGKMLFSEYDANKWKMAADACKMAVDTIDFSGIELFKFDKNEIELPPNTSRDEVPEEVINVLTIQQSLSEQWTDEKLFVSTNGSANKVQHQAQARTHVNFANNYNCFGFYSPTLRIAEMFYTKNGVPIDEDLTWDYPNRYGLMKYDVDNDSDFDNNNVPDNEYFVKDGETTINLHLDREVRFYGSLGFDRGIWYGNPGVYITGGAQAGFKDHYVEGRASEYSGTAIGSGIFSQTGYFPKKLVNFDNTIESGSDTDYITTNYAFPEMRLADLYLLYAECSNEVDDRATAYIYIDKVRARANLKGVVESWASFSSIPSKPQSKEGFRDIVQQERLIELVFEGHRFWDLKRWKLAEFYMNRPFRGWNYLGETAQDFYVPNELGSPSYSFKNNLWPIETNEILSNPNLIQNGGW